MHMLLVIFAGLLLLSVFGLFGWLWGHDLAGVARGARLFMPVWVLVALVNMWVGVTRAGYSVAQEAPILLIVAGAPLVAAALAVWKLA
ncbi:hypothetical protein [Neomegalonema sp.]|uniref:hypothetical protein n=1 Tax=Neomegalonema sp. TaxID=2039713 RepID=UPI002604E255|nr:hypothetical protein [Neomegalonema sp.]MDD2868748.1 hypothetical protein [Neomegalonema sp.]